jgi:aryl-alcohol dehydrogenase-like predicted oxidoreductase
MQYRVLGSSGLKVSAVGFGAWGIGGPAEGILSYGPTEDRISLRALEEAVACGINFFDTAPLYGRGHSEELLGQAFARRRDQVILASKTAYASHLNLRDSLIASLRRLRSDYLDLLQLHDVAHADWLNRPEALEELTVLRREGLIRAWGLSLKSPEDGLAVLADGFKPDALQVNFNLTDQRALESGLLERCAEQNVGVIVRTPLCFGFLTGRYRQAYFDPADHRSRWEAAQIARWEAAFERFQALLPTTEATPAQQSLRFCLSAPGVSTVIPGMLTAEHVQENAHAGGLTALSPSVMMALRQIYQQHIFFKPTLKHEVSE